MYQILSKRRLAENVTEYVIHAPMVPPHAAPGQFVIVRIGENGERVPFTIVDTDRDKGTVTLLVQEVGYTTKKMALIPAGGALQDVVGPLGSATRLEGKKICLVAGGIGAAVVYPQAKALFAQGRAADVIVGARNTGLLMYADELSKVCRGLFIITDDGSSGRKGFVTDVLTEKLNDGAGYDEVFAVGPMPMMRAVCRVTENKVKTVVSMNCIMVDGTGMCGGCRLTVGGGTVYACVDGPEFDGHAVDWDAAIARLSLYKEQERAHLCRLTGEVRE
ncbi:MAG: sulfide/dihydroorotate dehydrogenase-like FAD/NAD-binding protein [Clostridiales bacterium]|jgi:ferredoxin--NADP+ reductase|nr:sulfide/dihydroorotate dehydrogenase-like FAD/NAD-binding protein [Clostridiales bacterium]